MKALKITFIRPNLFPCRSKDALEPVVFGILKGLTPSCDQCVLYDERLEEIPLDEETDLVAITVDTFTSRRAYQLATNFVRRGVPVVLGGYHPTFCPEEALQFADSVVTGDAEEVWPTVVEDARLGQLQRTYRGVNAPIDQLRVDRSIFQGKSYRPVTLVQYGRGCKYNCDFCSIHTFYGSTLRWRNLQCVVEELAGAGRHFVFFTDDNLFNSREKLIELMDAIRPLGIHWSCQASIDVAADRDLVRQMADSGCMSVMVGFESLNDASLQQMRKSWQLKYGSFSQLIDVFRSNGIMVYGGFVLGYDDDTPETFQHTLDFALENKLFLANFNPLAPTPGTPLYERLKYEGRLLHEPWWLHENYRYGDAMFQPRGMTPQQLQAGCYWARTEFNRARNILRRSTDLRANCRSLLHTAGFALANLTARREIHRKQGQKLGDPEVLLEPLYSVNSHHEQPA